MVTPNRLAAANFFFEDIGLIDGFVAAWQIGILDGWATATAIGGRCRTSRSESASPTWR